jgi:hypothetical protein
MRLQTVPARNGMLWVQRGFRVFFRRPMAFAALFAAFMFAVFLLALLPAIGPVLVLAALPLVSLAFMLATSIAVRGGFPTPRVFIDPLRVDRARLMAMLELGLAYAVATYAVMWLSDMVDGGAFEALMDALPAGQGSADDVAQKIGAPGLAFGMLLRFGLAGILAVPFWHAPALVYWDNHGCAKALFSSTLACWRNRGAFAVYGLVWFALIASFGVLGSMLFSMAGQPQLLAIVAVPVSLIFSTVFYVSLYFTFSDCFVAAESVVVPDAA